MPFLSVATILPELHIFLSQLNETAQLEGAGSRQHHDVIPVKQLGLERAPDMIVLRKAREMARIFLTRDKDFGSPTAPCSPFRAKPMLTYLPASRISYAIFHHSTIPLLQLWATRTKFTN